MNRWFLTIFFVIFPSLELYSYDLKLSLKNEQEVINLGGTYKGGVFTSEGFMVTAANTGLIIPIPVGTEISQGYLKISMKKVPPAWNHEPDNCDVEPDYIGEPWAKTLFGLGTSKENLWAGEGKAGFVESHFMRCDNACWPGYRGGFRHKFNGSGAKDFCWATTVDVYHFCNNDPNETLEIEHEWFADGRYHIYENGGDVTAAGSNCGVLKKDVQWYVHIAHGDDNQYATDGDITGAIFHDLEMHTESVGATCGDSKCEGGENCENCPKDCGCTEPCNVCNQGRCECNTPGDAGTDAGDTNAGGDDSGPADTGTPDAGHPDASVDAAGVVDAGGKDTGSGRDVGTAADAQIPSDAGKRAADAGEFDYGIGCGCATVGVQ